MLLAFGGVALAGDTDPTAIEGVQQFQTPGGNTVNALFLEPIPVTAENLNVVVDAGWITQEALCQGVTGGPDVGRSFPDAQAVPPERSGRRGLRPGRDLGGTGGGPETMVSDSVTSSKRSAAISTGKLIITSAAVKRPAANQPSPVRLASIG